MVSKLDVQVWHLRLHGKQTKDVIFWYWPAIHWQIFPTKTVRNDGLQDKQLVGLVLQLWQEISQGEHEAPFW